MKRQSFENHRKFYTPHHFVFYPIIVVLLFLSLYEAWKSEDDLPWIFISILIGMMGWLSFMLRQHYALTLQNRIIRLEISYRYFALTGKRLEERHHSLRDSQLFALRFASDAEFEALLEKALHEKLSGMKVKKAIRNWKADHHRV